MTTDKGPSDGSSPLGQLSKNSPRREFLEQAGLTVGGMLAASGIVMGGQAAPSQRKQVESQLLNRPVTDFLPPGLDQKLTPGVRQLSPKQLAALATGAPDAPKNVTLKDVKSLVDALAAQFGESWRIPADPMTLRKDCCCCCCCSAVSVTEPVRRNFRLA